MEEKNFEKQFSLEEIFLAKNLFLRKFGKATEYVLIVVVIIIIITYIREKIEKKWTEKRLREEILVYRHSEWSTIQCR